MIRTNIFKKEIKRMKKVERLKELKRENGILEEGYLKVKAKKGSNVKVFSKDLERSEEIVNTKLEDKVIKIMHLGVKGYSRRHKKMYKSKVSNYSLYKFNRSNFEGLEIVIKGRLRGALRAGKQVLTEGTVSKNSLKTRLEYNELGVRSKTGILNVKVSLAKRI